MTISGFDGHFVGHCRNHLVTIYSGSPWSKIPDLPLEFRCYMLWFQWYNYFRFYRDFWLSFDVIVTCWHFLRGRPGRKPGVRRRNCSDICHTIEDISSSGLDGHIAICSSLLRILSLHFPILNILGISLILHHLWFLVVWSFVCIFHASLCLLFLCISSTWLR